MNDWNRLEQQDELKDAILAYRTEVERLKRIGLNQYGEVPALETVRYAKETVEERLREVLTKVFWSKVTEIGGGKCYLQTNLDDIVEAIILALRAVPMNASILPLPHKWSPLMVGFIPSKDPDTTSTGTFDIGGPSLDNVQWESMHLTLAPIHPSTSESD